MRSSITREEGKAVSNGNSYSTQGNGASNYNGSCLGEHLETPWFRWCGAGDIRHAAAR